MKSSVLDCLMRDGTRRCVSNASLVPILEIARKARDSGMIDGEVVLSGLVQSSERPMPVMQFKCRLPENIPPVATKKKK